MGVVDAAVLLLLATLAFWSLVVWKLLWSAHMRQGWRGHSDLIKAAFADFGHQTRVHLGYAAVMLKACLNSQAQPMIFISKSKEIFDWGSGSLRFLGLAPAI